MKVAATAFAAGAFVMILAGSLGAADAPTEVRGVASITDGDTINLGAATVRLHGIDAPEASQHCERAGGGTWPCGQRATERLGDLVEGSEMRCAVLDRDQYGRLIGRCAVSAIAGLIDDVGALMVREGLAWAYVRFSEDYVGEEAQARAKRHGIWQGDAQPPWEYRAERWRRAADAAPKPQCPIKGNISRSGERIYHTPWSPWYDRTVVSEANGERWFCDEAEAITAGWRGARFR